MFMNVHSPQRETLAILALLMGCTAGDVSTTPSDNAISESPSQEVCGNGVVIAPEVCDDGVNDGAYGGCNADCTLAHRCADGVIDAASGEACDDGNARSGDGCTGDCTAIETDYRCPNPGASCISLLTCGDGLPQSGELCDDGVNDGAYGGCNSNCTEAPRCSDGEVNGAIEACDDGNTNPGDGCSSDCLVVEAGFACPNGGTPCVALAACGNGVLDVGEACDQGNNTGVYGGCNTDCTLASRCGDGSVDQSAGEVCDDRNSISADGCSASCDIVETGYACPTPGEPCTLMSQCGNNILDTGEQCDDGINDGTYGGCNANCTLASRCGDGALDSIAGEACDDGNEVGGDGCNARCVAVETGYVCTVVGGPCVFGETCGDGRLQQGEACDDGNSVEGDGCSALCLREPGQNCSSASLCASNVCVGGTCACVDDSDCFDTAICNVLVSPTTCEPANLCGNGRLEAGEFCDDGSTAAGDGCSATCLLELGQTCIANGACASQLCEGSCVCDDNADCSAGKVCDVTESPNRCEDEDTCGNGAIEAGERCDDGAAIAGDGCNEGCLVEMGFSCAEASECATGSCDGVCECGSSAHCPAGQVCDLSESPNTCEANNNCGNGVLENGEGCDDGNEVAEDGCNDACFKELGIDCATAFECESVSCDGVCQCAIAQHCGPGFVCDTSESPNGCEAEHTCGNNVRELAEDCDQGAGNLGAYNGCNSNCTLAAYCGDGQRNAGFEVCDDGNIIAGDGCDSVCRQELGYNCPIPGSPCEECGDGIKDPNEVCDDDNRISGDGCAGDCRSVDIGWDCGDTGTYCDAAECGDGIVAGSESCDDGNRQSGDGCNFLCRVETGSVCPIPGQPCVATVCGDQAVEGSEQCDDGLACQDATLCTTSAECTGVGDGLCTPRSGDGCDDVCALEEGFFCPTPGAPCQNATCGNGVVEGRETCDDGGAMGPGCSATCTLEPGYTCPIANSACIPTSCGDGVREGLEACDDGTTCPSGRLCANNAECAGDGDGICVIRDGDGCSTLCAVEPLYQCIDQSVDSETPSAGVVSRCGKVIEYVQISQFLAPMAQPQAVHYDPTTRSFVAYGFSPDQGNQEVCLDGTLKNRGYTDAVCNQAPGDVGYNGPPDNMCDRPRHGVGNQLDGATYDPFTGRVLFIQQSGRLTEVDLDTGERRVATLSGLGTAGGIAVGNDGRLYGCNHFFDDASGGEGVVRVFSRAAVRAALDVCLQNPGDPAGCPQSVAYEQSLFAATGDPTPAGAGGWYLDNLFTVPGSDLLGTYNEPWADPDDAHKLRFLRYLPRDGIVPTPDTVLNTVEGTSALPGLLVQSQRLENDSIPAMDSAVTPLPKNSDGGEAGIDTGFFLICSEYDDDGGNCKLFAKACLVAADCAAVLPGASCKTSAEVPYCYLPERARPDRFIVDVDTTNNLLDLTANDALGNSVCTGGAEGIVTLTSSPEGATVSIRSDADPATLDRRIDYTPPAGICGVTDVFSYTADLGDTTQSAQIEVVVRCICGNGNRESGEQCDDGNTTAGDGCSPNCIIEALCGNSTVETGEQCDDGNTTAGDGCSPNCLLEAVCGNSVIQDGEDCDDGNTLSGDGCRSNCTLENVCGDRLVDPLEFCDDGRHCQDFTACTSHAECAAIGDAQCIPRSGDGCTSACEFEE